MKLARLSDGSAEIFHSLQGEGPHAGTPAVFIRVALCNLRCRWCDTAYTWNFQGTPWRHDDGVKFAKSESVIEMSPEAVGERVRSFPARHLVLTGGEPLLQQRGFSRVLDLLGAGYFTEVETNGTLVPEPGFSKQVSHYNVSPKLPGSGNPLEVSENAEALAWFRDSGKAIFKFVVSSEQEIVEIKRIKDRFALSNHSIFLMPEGRSSKDIRPQGRKVASLALENGWRFSDRLHLHLYGARRGT